MSENESSTIPARKRRRLRGPMNVPEPEVCIDLTTDSPAGARIIPTRARVNPVIPCEKRATSTPNRQSTTGPIVIDTLTPRKSSPRLQNAANRAPGKSSDSIVIVDSPAPTPPARPNPEDRVAQINESTGETPNILMCPICYEDLRASLKPTSTKCGHLFCEACIEAVLAKRKKCPVCMKAITFKSCIRLHF